MVTVISLYICISYIYTFGYISSLHSYCISIFFVTYFLSLIHLLSILLLYSSDDTYTYACLSCVHNKFHLFIQVCLSYMTFMVIYYTICYVLCSCTVFMYSFHIQFSYFTFHITFSFILAFHIILYSYTFSYSMSDRIISCYRTYHHIAVLCFSDNNISFHMSYSNHLFYVSCL